MFMVIHLIAEESGGMWRSLDVEWSGCVSLVAREGEVAAAGELCRGETREQ